VVGDAVFVSANLPLHLRKREVDGAVHALGLLRRVEGQAIAQRDVELRDVVDFLDREYAADFQRVREVALDLAQAFLGVVAYGVGRVHVAEHELGLHLLVSRRMSLSKG
jgi:hypothetical protein